MKSKKPRPELGAGLAEGPAPPLRAPTWSIQDAKNQFSAVVQAAHRAPQTVTKHGKAAVVIVDAQEFKRLSNLDQARKPTFVEHLLSAPQIADDDEELFPRLPGPALRDIDFSDD
jgi:antitoxin Phd